MEDLRYPIGPFVYAGFGTRESRSELIAKLAETPSNVEAAVAGLTEGELDTPYRSGGWAIRQVVHHLADAKMSSFSRFKLALTEANPTIKPYSEAEWAELPDSRLPIAPSMDILRGVHVRWNALLLGMAEADFAKTFVHPEAGETTLDKALAMYAWHSQHHTAHIRLARRSLGK